MAVVDKVPDYVMSAKTGRGRGLPVVQADHTLAQPLNWVPETEGNGTEPSPEPLRQFGSPVPMDAGIPLDWKSVEPWKLPKPDHEKPMIAEQVV